MIKGVFILLLFQCLGELIKGYFDLAFPAPVIGMFLLFIGLCLWQGLPIDLHSVSESLLKHLPLLIMPPAVGLFFLGAYFRDQWLALSAALIGGTALSFVFNAVLLKRLLRR